MSKTESEPILSDLEAWILETIDNIGWYAYLWFPVISREVLNFPCDKSDEEVYAAFSGLIRKGALKMVPLEKWGDIPEWKPEQAALLLAKDILRSRFGWPDSYTPPSKAEKADSN